MCPQPQLRMSQRMNASPALRRFLAAVEPHVSNDDPERFWQCRDAFAALLQTGFLRDTVNYELEQMRATPHYVPAMIFEKLMVIAKTEHLSLAVRILRSDDAQPNQLHGTNEHQLVSVLAPGGLHIETYRQPAPYPHDVLNRSSRLIREADALVPAGSVFEARAAESVFLVRAGTPSALAVTFGGRGLYRVRWQYDRQTLFPNSMVAVDGPSSRLEYTAWMLGELSDPASVPALSALLSHPAHQVRWSAIRAITRLDGAEGIRLLEGALADPHPHIRSSARSALERLGVRSAAAGADAVPLPQNQEHQAELAR